MSKNVKILVIGAHPDDGDLMFGGSAALLSRHGATVKFVSLTSGGSGHHSQDSASLIARRYAETQASAKVAGLYEYEVLDNHDGYLENTLRNREWVAKIIRKFAPTVVITHRLCDYHPDHRTTSQLVLDTAYLVRVPKFCPSVPVPAETPIYAYSSDNFTDPRPFRVDASLNIDSVIDIKAAMLDSHKSQFYEWFPWIMFNREDFEESKLTPETKREWLAQWLDQNKLDAKRAGLTNCEYAEVLELSEYGRQVSKEEFQEIFNI